MRRTTHPSFLLTLAAGLLGLAGTVAQAGEAPDRSSASPDPAAVEFLLAASAKDFALPDSPHPANIRKARVGHLRASADKALYLLCGEFLPAGQKGAAEWTPFATIKTGDYEQWLGGQAVSLCKQRQIKWYGGDHAAVLMRRIRERP